MARIVGATLLIIVLINCFSDRAARCDEFHSAGFTTREIRRCRCSKTHSGRIKCPKPLIPINQKVKQNLNHCLCCRNDGPKTPSIQRFCDFPCYQPPVPL